MSSAAEMGSGSLLGLANTMTRMDLKAELRWLWKYGLPAAPILAVLVYGILRQLYAKFYGTLGASPEEVGLGYQQVLALSGVAILVFTLVGGAFFLLRLPLLRTNVIKSEQRLGVTIAGAVLTVLFLAAGTWWLDHQTGDSASRAYRGESVTSVNFGGVQVLGLRAEPALIQWFSKPPAGTDTISGHCLMYLGTADGVDVFFDPGPGSQRTIRVQASAIVMTVFRAVPDPSGRNAPAVCSSGQVESRP